MDAGGVFSQIKTLFQNLSAGKRITFFLLIVLASVLFFFIITWAGRPDYQLLYAKLPAAEAGEIVNWLKQQRIDYQIGANGTSILIPREKIYDVRMQMASQGLPHGGGVGFEIFDSNKLGETEFVQNINYQRALQGELSRTINNLDEVESSRVHIVMAGKSLFIEDQQPATASVVLKLKPGKYLTRPQVLGIVHLVSAAVSGLKPENVTVVDNFGKILSGFDSEMGVDGNSVEFLDYQQKVERNLESRIKSMLENVFGPSKVIVRAACKFDFKKQETTEEKYLPANKVVRSEKKSKEFSANSANIAMGIPGKTGYSANVKQSSTASANPPAYQKQDQTVNYEIGRVTSHVTEPAAKLVKTSVAVMVDGSYRPVKAKGGKTQMQYVPRSPAELQKVENIVKRAMNFDAARGDQVVVENMPFAMQKETQPAAKEKQSGWMAKLAAHKLMIKYGIAGFILFFTFLFIIRPMVRWLTGAAGSDVQLLQQLPKTVGEIESEYDARAKDLPYTDQATKLVMRDNTASMQLIRDWMKQE